MDIPVVPSFHEEERRSPALHLLIVVSVLVVAFVGLPVVASAGPPSSFSVTGADIWCESESGVLGLHVDQEEGFGFLDVFFESFEEPFGLSGFSEEFSSDGSSLSAELEMFAFSFENGEERVPVGIASVQAVFDPAGEPEVFTDRFRDGNRWVEIRDVFQPAAITGNAFLEGYLDFDVSDCEGNLFETEIWSTNPNIFAARF